MNMIGFSNDNTTDQSNQSNQSTQASYSYNEVLLHMSQNCFIPNTLPNQPQEYYKSVRNELVIALRHMSRLMSYTTSTFYLSVCYMDVICSNSQQESFDYLMMATCCLLLASKYNETDSSNKLQRLFDVMAEVSSNHYYFTIEDLHIGELLALKILDYKLNYYTLYDFVMYSFTNGIVLEELLGKLCYGKQADRLRGKIYAQALSLVDFVIEDSIMLDLRTDLVSFAIIKKSVFNVLSMIPFAAHTIIGLEEEKEERGVNRIRIDKENNSNSNCNGQYHHLDKVYIAL